MPVWIALAAGVAAVSSASIFIRFLDVVPALAIAAWRLSFATLLTVLAAAPRGEIRRPTSGEAWAAALSGLFLAVHFAAWIESLKWTTVASSVVLVSTTPIWVGLLSHFWLKERLNGREWVGIGLAVLGGALVGLGDIQISLGALWGDFLALVGAWTVTGYFLLGRRLRREFSLLGYTVLAYPVAALALILAALLARTPLLGYGPREYFLFFLLAAVPQMIGHNAFNWALGHVKASLVAVTILGEPVGAGILAYLIFREVPTPLALVGGVVLLAGIYVTARAQEVP